MYIHIGDRNIISSDDLVAIFNIESLKISEINNYLLENIKNTNKTIIIDKFNNKIASIVHSETIIKRKIDDNDYVWRKK